MNVKDKTVLITGGANGIGFSYAVELLRHDVKCVAILDLPNSNGEAAVSKLESQFGKGRAIFLHCDVTDAKQLTSCFNTVIETFKVLDILINNAGIMNDDRWELMININFNALVRASILATDHMRTDNGGKGGTIVNIASVVGLMPSNIVPIYTGTKHAVVGFSRSLSKSYDKTGVRILVMCPGVTDTPLATDTSNRFLPLVGQKLAVDTLANFFKQTTEHVARSMIYLLENGKNGDVCVSEDGEPLYAVNIPDYKTLKTSV